VAASSDVVVGPKPARRFLRNLPVGKKLLLGFGTVAGLLFVSLGLQLVSVHKMDQSSHQAIDISAAKVRSGDDLRSAAAEVRAAQLAYVVDGGAARAVASEGEAARADAVASLTRERSNYSEAVRAFDESLVSLRASATNTIERGLATRVETSFETFRTIDQFIWESIAGDNAARARELALGPESLAFEHISSDAADYATEARTLAASSAVNVRSTVSRSQEAALLGALVTIILVVLLSITITRSIRNPLTSVQQAAERAAHGDLSGEVSISGEDETGRLASAFNTMLGNLRQRELVMREESRRQELEGRLHRALEMADEESTALTVVTRAMSEIVPSVPVQFLMTGDGNQKLAHAADSAGTAPSHCSVDNTQGCVAIKNGRPMTFETSEALDACPKLRDRACGPISAACVPVMFNGTVLGILHATNAAGEPPREHEVAGLRTLASQSAARLGMIRSMNITKSQAMTDPLTSLKNRRAFDIEARRQFSEHLPFALAMADLDRFKMLNDTYGHEVGDKALKLFSEVLAKAARNGDQIARWGGEEFVLMLPGCTGEEAVDMLNRLRLQLATRLEGGGCPAFTASFGVAESSAFRSLDDVIRAADVALYVAKEDGRDQVVLSTGDLADRKPKPRPDAHADEHADEHTDEQVGMPSAGRRLEDHVEKFAIEMAASDVAVVVGPISES
jgi:diguanylate cyclase (GGDEF)-like protein